jgi:hypothetical protein
MCIIANPPTGKGMHIPPVTQQILSTWLIGLFFKVKLDYSGFLFYNATE